MTELQGYLQTIQPELDHTARLFDIPGVGEERDVTEPGEEGVSMTFGNGFRMRGRAEKGLCRIVFSREGTEAAGETPFPEEADPRLRELHRKRAARRLCKQTLYDLCRKHTGIHPPWGSLTGVRPTHLMLEALSAGMSPEQAEEKLIREFDVTAEKARLLREVAGVQAELPEPGDEWMDVYIGIPFCTTRCAYCTFSSGEIGDGRLISPYMEALEKEMADSAALMKETGRKIRALYVGGGTPTALPEKEFRRLTEDIMTFFPGAVEYTVEAGRPDTLTRDKLRAIREAGVRRISINPQTMNDRTLQIIGRAHTAQQVREAYAMAREERIGHINMDVIAGLPGEGEADFARTMEEARRLGPESLTVHTLALKRNSRMSLEKAPLPEGEMTGNMVRMGRDTAREMGMRPYYLYKQKYMAGNQENTAYALPGHECLYNVDMMEETSHILAVGAGAISKRIYPQEGRIGRAPNVSNIEVYIARREEMSRRKRELFTGE